MNTYSSDEPPEDTPEMLEQQLAELLKTLDSKPSREYPIFSDISTRLGSEEDLVRVDLRRSKDRLGPGKPGPDDKMPEKSYVTGIMPRGDLPEEGEVFQMHYHCYDGVMKFGHVSSFNPINSVSKKDDQYFFSIDGVEWILSIIDSGS